MIEYLHLDYNQGTMILTCPIIWNRPVERKDDEDDKKTSEMTEIFHPVDDSESIR